MHFVDEKQRLGIRQVPQRVRARALQFWEGERKRILLRVPREALVAMSGEFFLPQREKAPDTPVFHYQTPEPYAAVPGLSSGHSAIPNQEEGGRTRTRTPHTQTKAEEK